MFNIFELACFVMLLSSRMVLFVSSLNGGILQNLHSASSDLGLYCLPISLFGISSELTSHITLNLLHHITSA